MPVNAGQDNKGCFLRFGASGKKYYYTCGDRKGYQRAKAKAEKQAQAIYRSGYRETK